MKQLKFYKIAFFAMLLLNVFVMGILFFKPQKPNHPKKYKKGIVIKHAQEIMHLDDEQVASFKELAKKHGKGMKELDAKQRKFLKPLFQNIDKSNSMDSVTLQKAGNYQSEKIKLTLEHFKEIKSILKEDQYDDFNTFIKKASILLLSSGKPGARPRHPNKP